MWTVLCADDSFTWQNVVQEKLDAIIGPNNYEYLTAENAFTASRDNLQSAKDILSNGKVHLVIADSYFKGENVVTINGKQFGSKTLGEALIRAYVEDYWPLHSVYFTAFSTDEVSVGNAYDRIIREYPNKVTNIKKEFIKTNEVNGPGVDEEDKDQFERKIPGIFRLLAEELSDHMKSVERARLLELAENCTNFASQTFKISGEEWTVESFLAGWRNSERDLCSIAKDLVTPDLTLAFSRAFAIWGTQAITHDVRGKYFPDDASKITNKARTQIKRLRKKVKRVSDNLLNQEIGEKVLNSISEFNIPDNNTTYDRTLSEDREKYFQFKGEIKYDGPEGEIYFKLSSLVEKSSLDEFEIFRIEDDSFDFIENDSFENSDVEINIPIHNYFEKEFENFFNYISRGSKGAGADKVEIAFRHDETGHTVEEETFEAELHKNYVILRNKGDVFPEKKITKDPATLLHCFSDSDFSLFGRFYLAVNQGEGGSCELFDCTHLPAQTVDVEEVFPEESEIPSLLNNPGEHVTYYIFAFSCWRPR